MADETDAQKDDTQKTESPSEKSPLNDEMKAKIIQEEREKWENEQKEKEREAEELKKKLEEEKAAEERKKQEEKEAWELQQKEKAREKEQQRTEIEHELKKKEKEEKKAKSKGKWKIRLGILLVVVVLILAAGFLTFQLNPALQATSSQFPYSTSYDVWMPQGQSVDFAGTYITAAGTGDKVIVTAGGGTGYEMQKGEVITLSSPKRVIAKIFGITIIDTNYMVEAEFRGYLPAQGVNDFKMVFKTSNQVPQFLVDQLLPKGVTVRPIGE